jgi:site-specific DNA recombinase
VTQSFNTTTSMGRLTLNMLLSFAQFEREVTGERIRDKVAASKKRGIWMGGAVPLGYRVENRALHIVEDQAGFVRDVFRRYLEIGSVVRLKIALDAENVRLPDRIVGTGRKTGGGLISRGHLYHILSNPIYVGRLRHKERIHDGLHQPVVDLATWDRVQGLLADQTQKRRAADPDGHSFLAGKIFDDRGHRMGPSHAAKGSRRWRYYISRAVLKGRSQEAGSVTRVPAPEIERQVSQAVRRIHAAPSNTDDDIRNAIERVTVYKTEIEVRLNEAIATRDQHRVMTIPWAAPSPYRRRQIIQGAEQLSTSIRPMRVKARAVLVDALCNAHRWLDELTGDASQTIEALAAREGKSERSIRMTLSLAFVAPPVVAAAIAGRLPRGFGVKRLMDLPMTWSEQWVALGLKAPGN